MTTTKISICNHALSLIGSRSISSFDEETTTAEHCRNVYDQTRKSVLRDHPWSCAKKRTILAPVTTYPAFDFNHAFPLPKDFLRLIDAGQCQYEIENRHILSNNNELRLIYIFDNSNEDTWDSILVEAMALKLASRLCKPLTGSDAAGESAKAEYERQIAKARRVNAQERQSEDMQYSESSYLGGRY
ncbi:hypothetical protein [Acinetobacter bereziniae]|uniref:hypothetical protein n=1 Tax=Acinetobacter bereziniae TaxID=106648 RepID=UPI00300AF8EA